MYVLNTSGWQTLNLSVLLILYYLHKVPKFFFHGLCHPTIDGNTVNINICLAGSEYLLLL